MQEGMIARDVRGLIDAFCRCYSAEDAEGAMALVAQRREPVLIGIGGAALEQGRPLFRDRLESDWGGLSSIRLELEEAVEDSALDIAWAAGILRAQAVWAGGELAFAVRFTGIAERERGGWRWRHLHFSIPPESADALGS